MTSETWQPRPNDASFHSSKRAVADHSRGTFLETSNHLATHNRDAPTAGNTPKPKYVNKNKRHRVASQDCLLRDPAAGSSCRIQLRDGIIEITTVSFSPTLKPQT